MECYFSWPSKERFPSKWNVHINTHEVLSELQIETIANLDSVKEITEINLAWPLHSAQVLSLPRKRKGKNSLPSGFNLPVYVTQY